MKCIILPIIVFSFISIPTIAAVHTYPMESGAFYNSLSDNDKNIVNYNIEDLESNKIRSPNSTTKLYSALYSAQKCKTVSDEYRNSGEKWEYLVYFKNDLESTQDIFHDKIVNIDTTQILDINDPYRVSTISMLDIRKQQVYTVIEQMTNANSSVQWYIRNVLCVNGLKPVATTAEKRCVLQVLSKTQYNSPVIRALIVPLLSDENQWVVETAQKSLDDLALRINPSRIKSATIQALNER